MQFDIITTRRSERIIKIFQPKDLFLFLKRYGKCRHEILFTVTVSSALEVIGVHITSLGVADGTMFHPREIFYKAIKDNACKIIIAHNHPSSNLIPSPSDIKMTRNIRDAGKVLDIPLLDHLIFNDEDYLSFRLKKIVKFFKEK